MNFNLVEYHKKRLEISDKEIERRLKIKEAELKQVFDSLALSFDQPKVRVAVLGCADKRFVQGHKRILECLIKNL